MNQAPCCRQLEEKRNSVLDHRGLWHSDVDSEDSRPGVLRDSGVEVRDEVSPCFELLLLSSPRSLEHASLT